MDEFVRFDRDSFAASDPWGKVKATALDMVIELTRWPEKFSKAKPFPDFHEEWKKAAGNPEYGKNSINTSNPQSSSFITSYSATDINEHIAETLEEALRNPARYAKLAKKNKAYLNMLNLLRDYGFICPAQYAEIMREMR